MIKSDWESYEEKKFVERVKTKVYSTLKQSGATEILEMKEKKFDWESYEEKRFVERVETKRYCS